MGCNEKVDIWSFGVCVWELLTGELPYKNVDSSAIIWGVGSNSLQLPLPSTCPDGFKLLIKQCWSSKPRNRPSFRHILMHLDIAVHEDVSEGGSVAGLGGPALLDQELETVRTRGGQRQLERVGPHAPD